VPWRECGLFLGFVAGMRKRVIEWMVPGIFKMPCPVFAWPCLYRFFFGVFVRCR
jgi:hypothetical protein